MWWRCSPTPRSSAPPRNWTTWSAARATRWDWQRCTAPCRPWFPPARWTCCATPRARPCTAGASAPNTITICCAVTADAPRRSTLRSWNNGPRAWGGLTGSAISNTPRSCSAPAPTARRMRTHEQLPERGSVLGGVHRPIHRGDVARAVAVLDRADPHRAGAETHRSHQRVAVQGASMAVGWWCRRGGAVDPTVGSADRVVVLSHRWIPVARAGRRRNAPHAPALVRPGADSRGARLGVHLLHHRFRDVGGAGRCRRGKPLGHRDHRCGAADRGVAGRPSASPPDKVRSRRRRRADRFLSRAPALTRFWQPGSVDRARTRPCHRLRPQPRRRTLPAVGARYRFWGSRWG